MGGPVLFVGDLHLGRRPPLPAERLAVAGVGPHALSAAAAWGNAVAYAIERGVRAVVLAGDVVDLDRDRFEAFGHLEAGARALLGAGIPLAAVVGNHDWDALPRLAARLPAVRLLGEGGRWERWAVPGDPPLEIVGWSFPDHTVEEDPSADPGLADAVAGAAPGARIVGVVHGDLDRPGSPYAPLDRRRLENAGADAWLLGHIHTPDRLDGARPLGYLGSLAALDPGEPGVHGAWELEAVPGGVRLRMVPLSPVRFETVDVVLDDARDADAVMDAVRAAAQARLGAEVRAARPWLEAVVIRVRLRGRVGRRDGIAALLDSGTGFFHVAEVPCLVERIEDGTLPMVDLARLREEPTPAGEIARLLAVLEAGDIPPELLARARRAVAPWLADKWSPPGAPAAPDLREALIEAAREALHLLLEHRRGENVP